MTKVECTSIRGHTVEVPRERLVFRPAAYAIVLDGDRMLVAAVRTSGKLSPPGGGVDCGEPIEAALRREVREETGVELATVRFGAFRESFFYYDPLDQALHGLLFYYVCTPRATALLPAHAIQDLEAGPPRWAPLAELRPEQFQVFGDLILDLARRRLPPPDA